MVIDKSRINNSLSTKLVDARVAQIFNTFGDVLVTSSFGTTSSVLLHVISRVKPGWPVYFIDTGYHFDETLEYRDRLTKLMGLNVKTIKPDKESHRHTKTNRLWESDPDRCCSINKIEPLSRVKSDKSVWVSGLIGYQNKYRSNLDILVDKMGMLRFYPLIDWNKHLVDEYMELYGLPRHPLEERGYASIGCTHCTAAAAGRDGRWINMEKTECGLHK